LRDAQSRRACGAAGKARRKAARLARLAKRQGWQGWQGWFGRQRFSTAPNGAARAGLHGMFALCRADRRHAALRQPQRVSEYIRLSNWEDFC
jgi:hypothetical protein